MSKTADKKKRSSETAAVDSVKTGAVVLESPKTESPELEIRTAEPKAAEAKSAATQTTEPVIRIDSDVTRRIRQHARAHLKTEVCGVLIGESSDGVIEIRASIEALNAAQAGTHVTFTQDAWEEIYKVKDDLYPDARIVGWYHSHPGFGIFLSEHDLFIQENFFSSPGQIAWVYDPHSDDEGCFGWVAGKVARLTSISTLYQSGDPVEHSTKGQDSDADANDEEYDDESSSRSSSRSASVPLWVSITRAVLTHLTVLLAGFAIAFYFFPRTLAVIPNPLTGELDVIDYRDLHSYIEQKASILKNLQLQDHPPATNSPSPATSPSGTQPPAPSTAPPTAKAPAPAATPPSNQPSTPQSTSPKSDKPGSHQ